MSLNFYPYRKESGPENMATDLWLFQDIDLSGPIFRHYGWSSNEITFGYGQNWSWVGQQKITWEKQCTRRPTGGGIVNHGTDWTYALILPQAHPSHRIPALDLYEEIHLAIGRVLEDLGYETILKPCPIKGEQKAAIPGNCFAEPVGRDLMSGNGIKKLAGAAMKRTKKGILIQGTIDHVQSLHVRPEKFLVLFVAQLENLFREEVQEMKWGKGFEQERKEYVEKFSSASWRQNRTSP